VRGIGITDVTLTGRKLESQKRGPWSGQKIMFLIGLVS
jgi:hypothetical protein